MKREPLLIPGVALALGILISHLYQVPLAGIALFALAAVLGYTAALLLSPLHRYRSHTLVCCALVAGLLSAAVHRDVRSPKLNADDGESLLMSGCVSEPAVFSPGREQFTLDLAPKTSARISVNLKNNDVLPVRYGQLVETTAKIRTPRNFGNPGSFDYVTYLAKKNIFWSGSVSDPSDLRILPGSCGNRAMGAVYAIRTWALERIRKSYPDDPHTAALLEATLLGETSGVEKQWTSAFRITGTYHALVISGQHVSVLALSLLFILRLCRVRRVPALCSATAASWLYALVSGFTSPVVRAAGGFTLFLVASYCFRRTRVLNVLAAVAILYLISAPDELFDPSFQLSFLSAAAIAVFAMPLMERFSEPLRSATKRFDQVGYDPQVEGRAAQWRVELRLLARTVAAWTGLSQNRAGRLVCTGVSAALFAFDALVISVCVQFGLALPMISYFHRLSITGLSANVIVIPLLSLVVPLGFASMLTMWHPLAAATRLLLVWAEDVASWHMRFEPSWRLAALPVWISLSFALSLCVLAWVIRNQRRWVAAPLLVSVGLFFALCWQPWKPELNSGKLEVTAIDVGQGDSIFVAFPDGTTMLVDAGGFPGFTNMVRKPQLDLGEDVVSPYLWNRRIRHIDYAVLTHGHSDHMGGLAAVLDNFHPRALWIGAEPETREWRTVEQHAAADNVRIVSLTRTSKPFDFGKAHLRVLAPAPDYLPGGSPNNNDSLVLEVSYGKRTVLLTGDAERPVEDELVASGELHPVTLLKVGHHGSKSSSTEEFLNQINPQFALISDGYKNQFHHPHPTVLSRFEEHGTRVLRTDQKGALTFLTDGDNVQLSTFVR
ncbi:MAG: DNA internalization-related competence protein ComEC/Rec2 [Bryobacteraceae bacterium]